MLTDHEKAVIRKNLVNFRYVILQNDEKTELKPAPFHYELSDLLLIDKSNVAIQMFRKSGKTAYALRAYPFYALCYPETSRDYIVIIKQNQDQASAKLKDLIAEYESNPVLQANTVRIQEKSAKVFSLDVKNEYGEVINVRIEAFGKGSAIRGLSNRDRRPKVVILDDIQDKEDSRSDTVLETDWNWFLSDVMFLGSGGLTRIFLIGNNLGEKCVIERVINNAETMGYKAIRRPVMVDGKSAWPESQTIEQIEAEKKTYSDLGKLDVWYAEKMCQSVSDETRLFFESDYVYYTPALADKLCESASAVIATLDPASSTEKDACFRAISVVAVMPDGHWYILDMPYGRWDSVELINKMFETVLKWGVRYFGVEKGQLQQFIEPFLYKEMTRRNVRFNVTPLEHAKRGSKLERISMLQPRFKTKTVWFPDHADWLPELKAELAGVTRVAIKSAFIDLVDSLAMVEQMTNVPISGDPRRIKQRVMQLEAVR